MIIALNACFIFVFSLFVFIGAKKINYISCSSFVSWACTSNGEVLMRIGALNPSSSKLNQAWVPVNIDYEQISSPLNKVIITLISVFFNYF